MKTCYIFLSWLLMATVLFFVGCKSKGKQQANDANEPNVPQNISVSVKTSEVSAEDVLMTVNGVDITQGQLQQRFEQEAGPVNLQMPPEFFEQYKHQMREKLLGKLILKVSPQSLGQLLCS